VVASITTIRAVPPGVRREYAIRVPSGDQVASVSWLSSVRPATVSGRASLPSAFAVHSRATRLPPAVSKRLTRMRRPSGEYDGRGVHGSPLRGFMIRAGSRSAPGSSRSTVRPRSRGSLPSGRTSCNIAVSRSGALVRVISNSGVPPGGVYQAGLLISRSWPNRRLATQAQPSSRGSPLYSRSTAPRLPSERVRLRKATVTPSGDQAGCRLSHSSTSISRSFAPEDAAMCTFRSSVLSGAAV
jgi:hypothetical protein